MSVPVPTRIAALALATVAVALLLTATLPLVSGEARGEGNLAPQVAFAWSPLSPLATELVDFSATVSGGKAPYAYAWTFGDGGASGAVSPVHAYAVAGSYAVNLTLTDSRGERAYAQHPLTVAPSTGLVIGTLHLGPTVAVTSPTFFSVNMKTDTPRALLRNPAVGAFVNSTALGTFKVVTSDDSCFQPTDTLYTKYGTTVASGCPLNDTAFAAWLGSRAAGGSTIFQVPAEINNTRAAQQTVSYVENVLHIRPAYWDIGEAPQDWGHTNIYWTSWRSTDNSRDNAVTHAFIVNNLANAVHQVDPTAKLIVPIATPSALPGLAEMARVVGRNVTGYSMYLYPSGHGWPGAGLSAFYGGLNHAADATYNGNISDALASWRSVLRANCAACANDPILLEEYAPSHNNSVWDTTYNVGYPEALAMAASVTQALQANVSVFSYQCLNDPGSLSTGSLGSLDLLDPNDTVRPVGELYRAVLPDLVLGTVNRSWVASPLGTEVFAAYTSNGDRHSLLLVNTDLANALQLDLGSTVPTVPGVYASWAAGSTAPQVLDTTLGSSVTIPAQGLVLLTW